MKPALLSFSGDFCQATLTNGVVPRRDRTREEINRMEEVSVDDRMKRALVFEEIRAEAVRCFNLAYDGKMSLDETIQALKWIEAMCVRRNERIQS
jgi:hypothetical protein